MNILFVGDVVGQPGRRALDQRHQSDRSHRIDFTIVNIENAAGGVWPDRRALPGAVEMLTCFRETISGTRRKSTTR
jgi:hypothetical protein